MIAYLFATAAVFVVCFLAYRSRPEKYADLMGVSAMLALVFCIGNIFLAAYRLPDALLTFPLLDLFLIAMIYRSAKTNPTWWKVVMVGSLVTQLMLHAVTITLWKTGDLTQYGLWLYVVAINAFFIIQLLALASVGVGHGLDSLRVWLSYRRRDLAVQDVGS
jgi:hypothetical protein